MEKQSRSSSRLKRNLKERDRRTHMKCLIGRLASLVHPQPSKLAIPAVLDRAACYVNQMHGRIEKLKRRQALYKEYETVCGDKVTGSSRLPVLDIRIWDSTLEVNLITGLEKHFELHELIRILQEEGAQVMSFTYYNSSDSVIYTIKSQAWSPRIGMETTRIQERLKQLIYIDH